MIDKKNLWFLTLFSLILVLSIYYVTMPNELLISNNDNVINEEAVVVEKEADIVSALKVEDDANTLESISEFKNILSNKDSSLIEKSQAFDALKLLNQMSSKEEMLEEKIKNNFNLDSFIKIDGDKIRVVISSSDHDNNLANNIMKSIQEEFSSKMYISIQFK